MVIVIHRWCIQNTQVGGDASHEITKSKEERGVKAGQSQHST